MDRKISGPCDICRYPLAIQRCPRTQSFVREAGQVHLIHRRRGARGPAADERFEGGARRAELDRVFGRAGHKGVGQVEGRRVGGEEAHAARAVAIPIANQGPWGTP